MVGLPQPAEVVRPPNPVAPGGTDDALIATALRDRDDLAAARLALVIARRSKDEIWWRFAPTVGMFSSFRHSNVSGLVGRNFQWAVGLSANVTLYDAGLRYADLRSADARIRAALLNLQRAEDGVRRDIRMAKLQIDAARLRVDRGDESLRLAQEQVKVSRAMLNAGTGTAIEVNEAYDRVADAELAIIRANLDRDLAVLQLQRATGLFTAPDPDPDLVAPRTVTSTAPR